MALRLDILANTQQFVREMQKAGASAEEIEDALDSVRKGGVKDMEKLEDQFKELANRADDTGRKIGTGLDDGFDKAKKGATGLGEEAGQTAREMAASFDGSIESIGDGLQELAANGFSALGPAGLAAGAAVALAMGTAFEAINKAKEATDEAKNSTYEWAQAAAGAEGVIDLKSRVDDLTSSTEGLKNVQDIATVSGWEQVEVLKALATGEGLPALTAAYNEGANSTQLATTRSLELDGVLKGTAEGLRLGAAGADLVSDAYQQLGGEATNAGGKVDELGGKVTNLPDGSVTITADLSPAEQALQRFQNSVARNLQINITPNIAPLGIRQVGP